MSDKMTAEQRAEAIANHIQDMTGSWPDDRSGPIYLHIENALKEAEQAGYANGYAANLKGAAPPGHILDDAGNVRKVLGKLPVTKDGCVAGMGADIWYRPLGNRGVFRLETAPVLTGYLDGIPGSGLYEFFPEAEYSTREAALKGITPNA